MQGCNQVVVRFFTIETSIMPRIVYILNSNYIIARFIDIEDSSSDLYIAKHVFFEFSSIFMSLEIKDITVRGISFSKSIFSIKSDFQDVPHRNATICMKNFTIQDNSLYLLSQTGTFAFITL